jgi:hypothetical protein
VAVANPGLAQRLVQARSVEMGMDARMRKAPDVAHRFDFCALQHCQKLRKASIRMADRMNGLDQG